MRKIRYILTIVLVFVFVTSMAGNASAAAKAKWTVMVYISGDNNLEKFVTSDIETELAVPGSSAKVQVVALADRGPGYDKGRGDWQTTKLFHVTQGMKANAASAVADWGERDMGDPQTLIDFVTWTKANYPADHYALYFWGHGWNWHPGWVMEDDTDADTLDYDETKAAIPALGFLDVVGYDGCNMASIEILDLWHGHATAFTGSQEWVGGEGIQYDLVLSQLTATPNMIADQVAVVTAQSATDEKTWSALAVDGRLDPLLNAVDKWSVALTNHLDEDRPQYKDAFNATLSFWQAPMDKDLYNMAQEIKQSVSENGLKSKSQDVMDAFASVVLYERHAPKYNEAHGITIYHPSRDKQKTDDAYYRTLDFALETHWDEFLDAWLP